MTTEINTLMPIIIALHMLAAIVWVGGMFFAHQILRPIAASQLEPPQRLRLWLGVFDRFFLWVWVAVVLVVTTGFWMIFGLFGGLGYVGVHVVAMLAIGLLMVALYGYVYFIPYPELKRAVAAQMWPDGAKALAVIRVIVGTNLILGLLTSAIAAGGRYL
ncbi:CopD family protein [Candidatus Reidiella endopervernicosa]|nr:CopD family protein [Candidatus Reidiella endopervernicosa]